MTYGELDSGSDIVGAALASHGAGPGTVCGLFLPRGADLLIAQAGITKSGAAWLPFDADTPVDRIETCLKSAQARGLVTCRQWLPRLKQISVPVWALEDLQMEEDLPSGPRAASDDPAYVIYTSGSTGQPKGIVISHRSICHFLRAENTLLGVREEDRVYQGFSVAFDMSFEEIWIAYLVGATLWVAPPEVVGDPDQVVQALLEQGISVIHAVPTLMGILPELPRGVRLVNLGGEACPSALAQRLSRPGVRVFNTYGPTEACVSASLAELHPGQPVSIGYPLPNYGLLVVDEQRRVLPAGRVGELCVFGPGLALGYLGRPDLTSEKFVDNPAAQNSDEEQMYLTGDLARIEPGGPAYCLGRADNQVKIRGFRVELDEIAAVLTRQSGVTAAAVVIRSLGGLDQIVGFAVVPENHRLTPGGLRQRLAAELPPYMVPVHVELVADLPRLLSGKADHAVLRGLPLTVAAPPTEEELEPRDQDEAFLFAALRRLFPGHQLRPEADFFADLGGHSLLAARLVSNLRGDRLYAGFSVQEIYRERRLDGIAKAMSKVRLQKPEADGAPRAETPLCRRLLCGLAQAAVIPFFILMHMADWLAPFFVYHYLTGDPSDSIGRAVMWALGTFLLAQLANFAIAVAGKRWLAGSLPAGRFPLWGVTYFRWWLAGKFSELPDLHWLAATPWMPLYLRALGAKVGRDVMVDTLTLGAPELLRIDDGVSIGSFVNIENARVEGGWLILGPVHLERNAVVDSYAVLENDTRLGLGARLGGLSALAAGREIPAGEIWEGSPARQSLEMVEPLPARPEITPLRHAVHALGFAASAVVVAVLFFLPTFPAFMLIDWLDAHWLDIFEANVQPLSAFGLVFLLAVPAATLFVGLTLCLTAGLRWGLPKQTAGMFSIHSPAFWRKKFMALILDSSLQVLHGLYASVFAPLWLRLLGAKVGANAEVSTAEGMIPELLSLGADSFVADGALLGDEEVRGGWMILKPTRIGNRSFVGNGAYVSDGAMVPDDVLIGVQTRVPANARLQSGQIWMGSPPLLLPAREQLEGFAERLTFRPSRRRRAARATIEALRIVLPLAAVIATGYLIVILIMPLAAREGWGLAVAGALALAGCLYGLTSFLVVVALKWLLIGRYRPHAAPMWTPFVWISEAVTNLYESLAVRNFLDMLRGTPLLPWALRLLGARIGRGVYLNTTDLTEFDCVRIGDEAELNAWCGPQTHLFEDRVMKIGRVDIGARVTVGARSIILYNTRVGDGVRLGPLSLVVKGEELPPGTAWEGAPAASGRRS